MAARKTAKRTSTKKAAKTAKRANVAKRATLPDDPFQMRSPEALAEEVKDQVHVYGKGVRCDTEARGHSTPHGDKRVRIVVDSSEGFIPLWAKGTTLRWRFNERSMKAFKSPANAKAAITKLFGESLLAWGDAMPVKFAMRDDVWDFEIVMRKSDECDRTGCVLAMAFFPDPGRNKLYLYPQMFMHSRKEQVETLEHEIGHVFGLRHFFAKLEEADSASEIFGKHDAFSIMNYGAKSKLTPADKSDLKKLYQQAWARTLTQINGTKIKFVKPYHTIASAGEALDGALELAPARAAMFGDID